MPLQLSPWDMLATISLMSETLFTVPSTYGQIVAADPKRWLLVFSGAPSSPVFYSTSSAPGGGQGIVTTVQANQPLVLTLDQWGPFVTRQWFAQTGGVGINVTVFTASVLEWPTGLTPGVELPYRRADRRAAKQQSDADKRSSKVLKDLLVRYNVTIPEWLNNGGNGNGH